MPEGWGESHLGAGRGARPRRDGARMSLHLPPMRGGRGRAAALIAGRPPRRPPASDLRRPHLHAGPRRSPCARAPDGRTLTQLLVHVDFDCDDGYGASWSGRGLVPFKPPTIRAGARTSSARARRERRQLPRHRRGGRQLREDGDRHDHRDACAAASAAARRAARTRRRSCSRRRRPAPRRPTVPQRHAALEPRSAPGRIYAGHDVGRQARS